MSASFSRYRRSIRRSVRGSALVLVLVILMFAALALTKFVERAGVELLAEAKQADRERLRAEAYSALEVTLATLAEFRTVDGALYSPEQGWADPIDYAGYQPTAGRTIDIAFLDESGKLSLPRASHDQLVLLLRQIGSHEDEAARAADALLAWSKADYQPARIETDPAVYERAALPHRAPLRSLRSFEELADVAVARDYFFDEHGQPNAVWRAFADNVSLFSFTGINLNSARSASLTATGLDASAAGRIAGRSDSALSRSAGQRRYYRTPDEASADFGGSLPAGAGVTIKALRIMITVHEGVGQFQLNVVVTAGDATFPSPTTVNDTKDSPPPDSAAPPAPPQPQTNDKPDSTAKKLDYPFTVLAVSESNGGPPPPATPTAP